jgi:hypothetical protein
MTLKWAKAQHRLQRSKCGRYLVEQEECRPMWHAHRTEDGEAFGPGEGFETREEAKRYCEQDAAKRSPRMEEVVATMESGNPGYILMYADKLRDLPEFGMEGHLDEIKKAYYEMRDAEKKFQQAKGHFYTLTSGLLRACRNEWSLEDMEAALFGKKV